MGGSHGLLGLCGSHSFSIQLETSYLFLKVVESWPFGFVWDPQPLFLNTNLVVRSIATLYIKNFNTPNDLRNGYCAARLRKALVIVCHTTYKMRLLPSE